MKEFLSLLLMMKERNRKKYRVENCDISYQRDFVWCSKGRDDLLTFKWRWLLSVKQFWITRYFRTEENLNTICYSAECRNAQAKQQSLVFQAADNSGRNAALLWGLGTDKGKTETLSYLVLQLLSLIC